VLILIVRSTFAGEKSENRLSVWIYFGVIQVADQSGLRHNENPIAHQRLRQFGAYDDDGPTVPDEALNKLVDLFLRRDIDATGGFREKKNLTFADEPFRQDDLLLVSCGTAFNEYLREHDAEYLVICGSSTANCVITTAMNGWERNYKVIVLADTGTAIPLYRKGAIPLWEKEVPLGYGQHWEFLRNIQASYGDVMTHDEFFELIDRS
jgi:hypothetical protein